MKRLTAMLLTFCMLCSVPVAVRAEETLPPPEAPKVNNRAEQTPLGIDLEDPLRFSWVMNSDIRGDEQTAYRIVVSSEGNDGDMWDTGKVESASSISIPYEGEPLSGKSRYSVKVKVWNKNGTESPFSEETFFETAFLSANDWTADWIGNVGDSFNYLRKEFTVPEGKTVAKARAYVTGLGTYVMYLNGQRVGDRYLDPMRTYLNGEITRVLYSTYDVTDAIQSGDNAVGIQLQDGFLWGGNYKAICELDVTFTDGTTLSVVTDESWKGYTGGPYKEASYTQGEQYDARLEIPGWNAAGFDDTDWEDVTVMAPAQNGVFNYISGGEMLCDYPAVADWNGYTLSARVRIEDEISYVSLKLCADEKNGYMIQLRDNVTRPHRMQNGGYSLIQQYTLDNGVHLEVGKWYTLSFKINGSVIETYVDDVLVNSFTDTTFRSGKFGIRQTAATENFSVDRLELTDKNGEAVFTDEFDNLNNWNALLTSHRLVAQKNATVVNAEIEPVLLAQEDGMLRYDVGHNISGFVEVTFNGNSGDVAVITTAEDLYDDGTLDRHSYTIPGLSDARSTDIYTLKGGGDERYLPEFTSHGFRYFEITAPSNVEIKDVVVKSIGGTLPVAAEFNSSNALINKLYEGFLWGQRDNSIFFPQGCNNRIERHPWVMDGAVVADAAMLYFEGASFYEKWLDDFKDGDTGNGFSANVLPGEGPGNDVIWASGAVTVPWDYYMAYGDKVYLEGYYPRAKRYANVLESWDGPDYLIRNTAEHTSLWTDWLAVDNNNKADPDIYINLYYYKSIDCMYQMATALGKTEDAAHYADLLDKIQASFHAEFYNNGDYATPPKDKQAPNGTAISFGIAPEEAREQLAANLVDDIMAHDNHLTFGCIGANTVLAALTQTGYDDAAFALATQNTYPSWGYMVEEGPGTYWEHWTGEASLNHPFMGGGIARYAINSVGGVQALSPAYEAIQVKPYTRGGLTFADTTLHTVRGDIVVDWDKTDSRFTMEVTVPCGTSATIYVPVPEKGTYTATEGADVLTKQSSATVEYLRTEEDYAVYAIGSGTYSFAVSAPSGWGTAEPEYAETFDGITVYEGTPQEQWDLPRTAKVRFSDQSVAEIPVTWEDAPTSAGTYTVSGTLDDGEYAVADLPVSIEVQILPVTTDPRFEDDELGLFYDDFDGSALNASLNDWGNLTRLENGNLVPKVTLYGVCTKDPIPSTGTYRIRTSIQVKSVDDYGAASYLGFRMPGIAGHESPDGIWFAFGEGGKLGIAEGKVDKTTHYVDYSAKGVNFANPTALCFEDDMDNNRIAVYAEQASGSVLLMTVEISNDGKQITAKNGDEVIATFTRTNPVMRGGLAIWWGLQILDVSWQYISVAKVKETVEMPDLTVTLPDGPVLPADEITPDFTEEAGITYRYEWYGRTNSASAGVKIGDTRSLTVPQGYTQIRCAVIAKNAAGLSTYEGTWIDISDAYTLSTPSVTPNGETADVSVTVTTEGASGGTLWIASYSQQQLLGVKVFDLSLMQDTSQQFNATLPYEEGATVKAFIWKGSTVKPY